MKAFTLTLSRLSQWAATSLLLIFPLISLATANWNYQGNPNLTWPKQFPACQAGGLQSPIDVISTQATIAKASEFNVHFIEAPHDITNNGHSIQINFPKKQNEFLIADRRLALLQFHFHSPSEDQLDHHQAPLEMHWVTQDKKTGDLAVIAILLQVTKDKSTHNLALKSLWKHLPKRVNSTYVLTHFTADLTSLLPANRNYFQYQGSLTTPPCKHHIAWYLLEKPLMISPELVKQFQTLYHDNIRPLQALSGRAILYHPVLKTQQ